MTVRPHLPSKTSAISRFVSSTARRYESEGVLPYAPTTSNKADVAHPCRSFRGRRNTGAGVVSAALTLFWWTVLHRRMQVVEIGRSFEGVSGLHQ